MNYSGVLASIAIALLGGPSATAQAVSSFAGNAQHTANYQPAAQNLNKILWSAPINLNNSGSFAHYGAPLVTTANTVIVPVKTANNGFEVNAFTGGTGAAMYTLATDYILPSYDWIPVYQPVLATGSSGTRLYYAGAGGTVYYIDNPDSATPDAPVQQVFYGAANYAANESAFNSSVFIDTPITADSNGDVFFGFRVQGTAPAPLNTTQSGFARIDPSGNGTYVLAGAAAADSNIAYDSHNSAPALSNDQSTLYVVVKSANVDSNYAYLLGLNATTLATKYKVFLEDPRNGNGAIVLDDSTASPTVAPDNDVYFGIFSNPDNGSRGFLLRFSSDLSIEKTPGAFGWDITPGIVPATMAPSYTGSSSYLIFEKYNNYANAGDGDGVNKVALLDPNATQIDPHSSANGLIEMREVLTVIGVTPDPENYSSTYPYAVREWCINTPAINPASHSIFVTSEDGHIYRWNLDANSLDHVVTLGAGVGEPYISTIIGPDGAVYTLNGGSLFAVGSLTGVGVSLASSVPDIRSVVVGQSLTFTATVTNTGSSGIAPTGSVNFQDITFQGTTPATTTLASNVALGPGGQAAFTSSTLAAGTHFITATYSGDSNFSGGSSTVLQRIHASASTTALSSTPNPSTSGQAVAFTAAVASSPAGSGTPTGMVTFEEGSNVLAQVPLSGGAASFSTSTLATGSQTITAAYYSDSVFASSSGTDQQNVQAALTLSVTPTPAAGRSNTFALAYSDSSGNAALATVAVIFNTTVSSKSSCYAYYAPATNRLYLQNDSGAGATSITPGSGTLANSQCSISGSGTSVMKSGNSLTLHLDVTASGTFTGPKNIFLYAADDSSANTGWVDKGTWTPSASFVPSVVSVTPNPASGAMQTFALEYSDTGGNAALTTVAAIFNATVSSKASCYVYYTPANNLLYLQNDSGQGATFLTPGSGTLSNSQCTITGSGTSVMKSGNNLTLNLAVTASGTFTGKKNIFMYAADDSSANSGWVNKGSWTP